MNRMRARIVFVVVWVSIAVGAVRLFGDVGVRAAIATGLVGESLLLVARFRRRRRLRVWNVSAEPAFPPGPRRVLLAETGLPGPR
jgi:hypothetical protein